MGWLDCAVRSDSAIEAEISEEIEFHLEQRTRELEEQGLSPMQARAEAERRFGSVARVRADCSSVHSKGPIMQKRTQLALTLGLVFTVLLVWLAWTSSQARARTQEALQAERAAAAGHSGR